MTADTAVPQKQLGHPANKCEACWRDYEALTEPDWTVCRRGDAVISWACHEHLGDVCKGLQRPWEKTELVVTEKRIGGDSPDA